MKLLIISVCMFVAANMVAQDNTLTVTGKVYDMAGTPLAGVSIVSPGGQSCFTNDSGAFILPVASKMITISVEAAGYQYKEISLRGQSQITAKLSKEGVNNVYNTLEMPLRNVVKSQSTGSISSLNTDNIWKSSNETPDNFIAGKIAGLNTIMRSGSGGIGANMFLRGYTSLRMNNQPLIIVDGVIYDNLDYTSSGIEGFYQNALSDIDLKDIQSVTTIKDAASLYGSKAANGVILINTTHSEDITTKINFSAYSSLNIKPDTYPVMGASDYRFYLSDMLQSSGMTASDVLALPYMNDNSTATGYYRYHNNTNWQKELYKNSVAQNYHLGITGGDNIAKYALSIGFLGQPGVISGTEYQRYNTRFNADIAMTKRLSVKTNLAFTYAKRNIFDEGVGLKNSPLNLSRIKAPFLSPNVIDDNNLASPNLEDADPFDVGNPTAIVNNSTFTNSNHRFFGSAKVNYKLSDELNVNTTVGLTYDKNQDNVFIPHLGVVPDTSDLGLLIRKSKKRTGRLSSVYSDSRLSYNKTFNSIHGVAAILGFRYSGNNNKNTWEQVYGAASDDMQSLGYGTAALRQVGGDIGEWNSMSFYSNVEYNYLKKYLVSFNVSLDGSSRFGKEADGLSLLSSKFGVFPSVAAAWLISSENFMSGIDQISLLKLRLSYGITGNDDLGNYTNRRTYTTQNFLGDYGIVPSSILNPKLKWETVKKTNVGIDIALFNDRVTASFDVYKNLTEDMLTLMKAPEISGLGYYYMNSGKMQNTGYELDVNARVLNGEFKWDLGVGIAHYKNRVNSLQSSIETSVAGATIISQVGSPVGLFYGYKTDGVFATTTEASAAGLSIVNSKEALVSFKAGDMHFVDNFADGIIDSNDRVVIGDPNPDFTGQITNKFQWKRLTLDAFISFKSGGDVFNYQRESLESTTNFNNQLDAVKNRWRKEGQVTDIPQATYGDPMGNARFSDRWIEDGSYLRLKTVSLAYDVPIKPGFFRNASVYFTANNLLTFTGYLGSDPEFSMGPNPLVQGIDNGLSSQYKSFLIGIKLGL